MSAIACRIACIACRAWSKKVDDFDLLFPAVKAVRPRPWKDLLLPVKAASSSGELMKHFRKAKEESKCQYEHICIQLYTYRYIGIVYIILYYI